MGAYLFPSALVWGARLCEHVSAGAWTRMCVCLSVCVCVYVCDRLYERGDVFVSLRVCVSVFVYGYVCVTVYV